MHEEQLGAGDKRPVRPEEPLRRADGPGGIDGEGDRRRRFGRCLLPEGVDGAGHIPAGRPRILPRRHGPRDRLGGAVDDGDRLLINDSVDRHPGKLAVGVGEIGGGGNARVLRRPLGLRDVGGGGRVGETLQENRRLPVRSPKRGRGTLDFERGEVGDVELLLLRLDGDDRRGGLRP